MTVVEQNTTLSEEAYLERVCSAMRTVINHTVSDAFDLTDEETMWVSYHLERILEPISTLKPKAIALPVKCELQSGLYSQRIADRSMRPSFPHAMDTKVANGTIDDWCMVIADTIQQCYDVRPMVQAEIEGGLRGILTELGVGHPTNARAARYLPNSVRYLLAHKKN
jgi:hypothetical protein